MKNNFACPWKQESFIKSEPLTPGDSNSLDFETERDSSWRMHGTAPIKSSAFSSMNDTLEHLRALCLQQAASDVQRACRQLCISSNPHNWSTIDVQNWLQWLSNERKIDGCWKTLDFLMKTTGSELIGFCEKPRTWINLMELQSVHLLVMDKIAANLEIWRLGTQCPSLHGAEESEHKFKQNPFAHFAGDDLRISSDAVHQSYRRPSSTTLWEESDEEPPKPSPSPSGHHIHLWQFLRQLLANPKHRDCIRWVDRKRNIFKIENSVRVAKLWGQRKNRPAMNYDKLSRSIRQYYRKGIMRKTDRAQRLVYQFCVPFGVDTNGSSRSVSPAWSGCEE